MDDEKSPGQPNQGLSREQKVGFTLLLIFAIVAVGLGIIQIRNTMYQPFTLGSGVPSEVGEEINGVETLAYRDTDLDGLSDFDELYVYETSPYLADTDSDGITDQQEIQIGESPLCPHGRFCGTQVASTYDSGTASTSLSYTQLSNYQTDYDFTQEMKTAQEAFFNQLKSNPTEVRQLLIQQGMSADEVNMVSDEDLKALVDAAINSSMNTNGTSGSSTLSTTVPTVSQFSSDSVTNKISSDINLPPELLNKLSDPKEARTLLISQGFDKSSVDAMSDSQIIQMLQEVLNTLLGSSVSQ
ncbi:MAG: hypothetical protein WCX97_02535 [Candidatus Magasanikbacteria bacterium]